MRLAGIFLLHALSCHGFCPPSSTQHRPILSLDYSKALLFDCDGVILETEEYHRLAYNAAFGEFDLQIDGQPVEWSVRNNKKIERMKIIYSTLTLFFFAQVEYYDILQNTVGGGKPKMRFHFYNTTQQFPTVRGQPTPPVTIEDQQALIDDLQDFKTQYYTQLVQESAECRPGVLELMDAALAHPQLVVGVCSASTKAAAQQTLHCTLGPERLQQLDVLLLGDDVEYKKPHPAIYQQAAEILKLEPSDCIVIEDSLVGLKAAVAAGMRCCITYTSSTAAADFRDATWVVPNLVEGGMITLQTLFGDDDIDDSSET